MSPPSKQREVTKQEALQLDQEIQERLKDVQTKHQVEVRSELVSLLLVEVRSELVGLVINGSEIRVSEPGYLWPELVSLVISGGEIRVSGSGY